ncbi:MAG TPA: phenylalanine--tRNA ligase subunit beta [Methylophilaceae bacterium]|jgi:phenylalanyl-tRNA synthetase beta chain
MQFSENWLRQYVNTSLTTEQLSHALTMSGLEVEGLDPVGVAFTKVVIAQILSAEKHPDADRLQVCKVDVGAAEPLQIVCGASNARAGLKAPCALVGAALPGIAIKEAKVRGVPSFGMMCSEKELGLATESAGLLELPADAVVGQDIREYFDLDDQLFTLKLTPNRSDCLSLVGIAREVSALTGAPLDLPKIDVVPATSQASKTVNVQANNECPRYAGRMIQGVNAQAKTPDWLVRCIERSGVRSISAIVDITNYVLLEMGQPLHAFDANKLQGDVTVRLAKTDEVITLLNQQEIKLHPDMVVIADNSGAIAFAGVMGGASTSVSDDTTDIFLESAFFTPDAIAGKARRFGLSTDSSYRFERGVDYGNTLNALARATTLILQICGGQAGPVTEVMSTLPSRKPVILRLAKLVSVLGISLDEAVVVGLLNQLGFAYQVQAGVFTVTPPSYRFDIEIEEDLIEEIARLHGYDNIPAIAPQADLMMLPSSEKTLNRAILRDALSANGYQEVVNYSFVDTSWETDLLGNQDAIALKNPIASNMSVMRSGLWGGLLDTLVYNLNRKQERVRIFEIGASYSKNGAEFTETTRISGLAYGDVMPEQWADVARNVDFYDVKADVDVLTNGRAQYVAATHPALHPGQSAQVMLNGKAIGFIGKLHPKWQQHYQLARSAILFELDVAPLLQGQVAKYQEIAKFPPARRDLAVLVDDALSVQAVLSTMQQAKIEYVTEIALFDVYRGKGIAENKKSLAFLVLMQDTQKTLTDTEADTIMAQLLALIAQKHGAELRT